MMLATIGAALAGGRAHARLLRLRLVDERQHDVLRIVHREGGDEGVEALVARNSGR